MRILLDEMVIRMYLMDKEALEANYAEKFGNMQCGSHSNNLDNEIDSTKELYCTFLGEYELFATKSTAEALKDVGGLPEGIVIVDDTAQDVVELKNKILEGMGWKEDVWNMAAMTASSCKCDASIILVRNSAYCPRLFDERKLKDLAYSLTEECFHFSYPSSLLENFVWNMPVLTDRHPLYDDFKNRPRMLAAYKKDPLAYKKKWGVWLIEFCLRTGWGKEEFWETRLDNDKYNVEPPFPPYEA